MIRSVRIRGFKRFADETFPLDGNVVLAGPNNTGKTTVLQAIAAWSLALNHWKALNDDNRRNGYTRAPIARQAFSAVPLRAYDLLWNERGYTGSIEIEVRSDRGWTLTMELLADSTEQIYVRPTANTDPAALHAATWMAVYVPPMSGLSTNETVFNRPMQDVLLGQGKPGDVLRNLLLEAHASAAWVDLHDSIRRLFGYDLLPPTVAGAYILAEYTTRPGGPRFDIASAGSGFQQVMMLLAFLHARQGSVLLVDEPDAHLHVILQDAIYAELQSVAARYGSQLIVATHSEVIINSVDPAELCMVLDKPRRLVDATERKKLAESLGVLTQTDIALALQAPGILYLEGTTDLHILREWARILGHPAEKTLTTSLFWKPTVWEPRTGGAGVKAADHYQALQLVRSDLPGLILLDGDDNPKITDSQINGQGLQRLRWRWYEIESYLLHPAALDRFVERQVGPGAMSAQARADLRTHIEKILQREFLLAPWNPIPLVATYLQKTKARTEILPPMLTAAGLPGFPYTRYHEIAAVMLPGEIHPEVIEKLDALQKAFRL